MRSTSTIGNRVSRKTRYGLVSLLAVMAAAQGAMGAVYTWTAATPGTWNTTLDNWTDGSGGTKWVNSAATPHDAVFSGGTPGTVTIPASTTINVGTLTFGSSGWTIAAGNSTSSQINGGNGGALLTINTGSGLTNTLGVRIGENSGTPVLFTGGGTLTLSGASVYTGATTIAAGTTIKGGVANFLPAATAVTIQGGATPGVLDMNGFSSVISSLSTTAGAVAGTVTNGVATSGTLQVNDANSFTLTARMTGNVGLSKTGAGAMTIDTAQAMTGILRADYYGVFGTLYTPGTVILQGAGSVGGAAFVAPGASLIVDSTGNGAAATLRTAGHVVLGGGTLTVNGGTSSDTIDSFGGSLVAGNRSTLSLRDASGESQVVINPGSGRTARVNFAAMSQDLGPNAAGVLTVRGPNFGQVTGANVAQLFATTTAPSLFGTSASVNGYIPWMTVIDTTTGVASIATYDATHGVRPLSGDTAKYSTAANDYNTGTATGGGALNSGNVRLTSGTNISAAAGINSLTLHGSGITLGEESGAFNLRVGVSASNVTTYTTILSQGAGNKISTSTMSFGSTNAGAISTLAVHVDGDLEIASQITNVGGGIGSGITKSGPGRLYLSNNNNTFTTPNSNQNGIIRLQNGTLAIDSAGALGAAGNTLAIYGGFLELNPNKTTTVTQTVNIGLGTATFDPNKLGFKVGANSTLTLANGAVFALSNSQAGGWTKLGAGELRLNGGQNNGPVPVYLADGTMSFGSAGRINASEGRLIASPGTTVKFDSTASTVTSFKHINDVNFNASSLLVNGNGSNATTDTTQTFILNSGASDVTVNPGAGQTSTLGFSSVSRSTGSGGTLTINGTNLGKATSAATTVSQVTGAPSFTGNNLLADQNTPKARVVYFAVVNDAANPGIRLATYDTATAGFNGGYRGLGTATGAETTSTFAAGNNIELSGNASNAGISINSLTFRNTGSAATLTIDSGTMTVASGGLLSTATTGTAANAITGGILTAGSNELVLHVYSDLTIDSQITNTSSRGLTKAGPGTLTLTNNFNTFLGSVQINGGTLSVSADGQMSSAAFPLVLNKGGTLLASGTFSSPRTVLVNPGGATAIHVAANEVLTLTGQVLNDLPSHLSPATTKGTLTVGGLGTLRLNSTVTAPVSVASGATLGGTGTLSGGLATVSGAHLAPGNSIGTQTASSVTLAGGTELDFEFGAGGVDHVTPGSSDRIAITGGAGSLAFPVAGTVILNLVSGDVSGGGSYKLVSYSNPGAVAGFVSGDGVTTGSILLGDGWDTANQTFTIQNDATNGGIFLDVTATAVPEPMSLAVLGIGMAGLLLRRRK